MGDIFKKVFKDPLYDYISIDNNICDKIIDNQYFQRLRRIEQTSMRCLYPTARHDRFIHSLGVYHLAQIAIKALLKNEPVRIDKDNCSGEHIYQFPSESEQKSILFSFEMAVLLHDVGHSPFSHTLEYLFKNKGYKDSDGKVQLIHIMEQFLEEAGKINSELKEENFNEFKIDCEGAKAAPHVIASCIIIFKCFKEILAQIAEDRNNDDGYDKTKGGEKCKIKPNYLFIARCILGAQYSNINDSNGYKNCIIRLLNSSIDVDKLDYIARDSAVSGFANTLVDTKRLLCALVFAIYNDTDKKQKICLAFRKTAVGVIQNVVTSRNSLYTWIYSHHKVVYESELIGAAVEAIAKEYEEPDLLKANYFSVDSIENNLVCDDVIWNLFLNHKDLPEVNAVVKRNDRNKALWKSFAEFQAFFSTSDNVTPIGSFSTEQMNNYLVRNKIERKGLLDYVNRFKSSDGHQFKFDIVVNSMKLTHIAHNSIMIYINNRLYSFDTIFSDLCKKIEVLPFFYLYCSKDDKNLLTKDNYKLRNELIAYIKNFEEFRLSPTGC